MADCGVTGQHGNLFVRYQQLADDFGGACVGLRVSIYSIAGGFSCAQGVTKTYCRKLGPTQLQDGSGHYKAQCKDVGSPCAAGKTCHLYAQNINTGMEDDLGQTNDDIDPTVHDISSIICRCQK